MDDYFGTVAEQLMRLCDQGAHRRRWRRDLASRKLWPALGLAASVAVVVAVVAVALWAGGANTPGGTTPGSPHPTLTAAQQKRVRQIAYRILRPTGPACIRNTRLSIKNWRLSISHGAPDHAVLSTLGVLRRKATAADTVSSLASRPILLQARGVYVRYVRLARTFGGAHYYLVPAADVGGPPQGASPHTAVA
ncbi:hypothetical protein [Actinospica sp.]|jgi:hypothetical protein|uniref:hypothetical protein n=1 Tax=Actinospica sp. TaxID=1872142 RepID=UPI002BF86E0B|nr:hypothetical protein [Actinospica sp.]HWG26114.1 hypothetical protein [Actinospica sp.]